MSAAAADQRDTPATDAGAGLGFGTRTQTRHVALNSEPCGGSRIILHKPAQSVGRHAAAWPLAAHAQQALVRRCRYRGH
jgi:hypothetical protein